MRIILIGIFFMFFSNISFAMMNISEKEISCYDKNFYHYYKTENRNASITGPGNFKYEFYKANFSGMAEYCFTMTLPEKSKPACWGYIYKENMTGKIKNEGRCDVDNNGIFEMRFGTNNPLRNIDWSAWR